MAAANGVDKKEFVHVSKAFVGKPAPEFTATVVTPKLEVQEIKLSQYRGKYVVLFFYPLDFTFVCPTEIIEFSDLNAEFEKENCVLLGASVDSEFTHIAWMETDRKKGGIGRINCPLIADLKRSISKDYGVLMDNEGHTLRGLFIISDKGIVRHISMNDPPVGRNAHETLRLVKAFQYTDKWGEVCPAGWNKAGDKTIKPNAKDKLSYFATVPDAAPAAAAAAKK